MLDAQVFDFINNPRTFETDVLIVLCKQMKQNVLSQSTVSGAVRHSKRSIFLLIAVHNHLTVVIGFKNLVDRGRIELPSSPYKEAILPLNERSVKSVRESNPNSHKRGSVI